MAAASALESLSGGRVGISGAARILPAPCRECRRPATADVPLEPEPDSYIVYLSGVGTMDTARDG